MSADTSSLERLHDIVVPAAASWWPLAPGWQIVLGLLAFVLLAGLLQAFIHWQHNCYRREALQELKRLSAADNQSARLLALSALLKRTAITAFPREQVAAITGADWFAFLDRTGGTDFSAGLGQVLEQANYCAGTGRLQDSQMQQLVAAAHYWIKHHQT